MKDEYFKYGPLIVKVRKLGSADLLEVSVLGQGQEFTVFVPGGEDDMIDVAYEVLEQLLEASKNPKAFMIRRKAAIETQTPDVRERQRLVEHARGAVTFARGMAKPLESAVESLDKERARKLGGDWS